MTTATTSTRVATASAARTQVEIVETTAMRTAIPRIAGAIPTPITTPMTINGTGVVPHPRVGSIALKAEYSPPEMP